MDTFDVRAAAAAVLRGERVFHVIDVLPGERVTTHPRLLEIQAIVGNDYAPRVETLAKLGTHSQYTCEWRSVRHITDDLRAAGFVLSDD